MLLYSVLMSVYKKEKPDVLDFSIKSMLEQSLKPEEFVIVKDGPITPELQTVLDSYASKFPEMFTIVGYSENKGLAYALNYGLERCRNELVARMDSDDYSLPERCELQVRAFEKDSELAVLGSAVRLFSDNPEKPSDTIKTYPNDLEGIKRMIRRDSAFAHVSVMFKKSAVINAGGYDPLLRLGQDQDLFARMIFKKFRAGNLEQPLVLVRADENLKLRRKNKESCRSRIIVQKRLLKRKQCTIWDYLYVTIGVTAARIMPQKLFLWVYTLVKEK